MYCCPTNKKSVLLPHSMECAESFNLKMDRNFYVNLRQTYLVLKLKFVNGRGYESHKTKKNTKKEPKKVAKVDVEMEEEQEVLVILVTHVNNVLHSMLSTVEMYIKSHQLYISKRMYAQKPYICNKFKGAMSEYKGVLHCEGFDYE